MAPTESTGSSNHFGQPVLRARERRWLSVAELAVELGMSPMTLYRAIAAGEFPAVRIGRRLVVPARVLEDMADAALSTGTTVDTADWPRGAA
jgi:excisionase family DNA binding protein